MANEKRLIDANALIEQIRLMANRTSLGEISPSNLSGLEVCGLIFNAPTVDAVEVVHGRWRFRKNWDFFVCSECSYESSNYSNYCPNCGADMREREDNG